MLENVSAWTFVQVALAIYWIAVVLALIAQDRDPTKTLAWLLVLGALPFVGLFFYFFFGRDWPRITQRSASTRRLRAVIDEFMPVVYARYAARTAGVERDESYGRVSRLIRTATAAPALPVRTCEVYDTGEEYFDVLIADLRAAQRFIHMNYFIWKADELSERITRVLLERLEAGVEVRILNDYVGGLFYSKGDFDSPRRAGAHVASDVAGLARLNYSNHRKITVVDAEIGHTGGFNIGQEYIDGGKRFAAWRDTGLRMTGPGVADLEKLFDMRWYEVTGENLFDAAYYPDAAAPGGDVMVQTVHHGYDDHWKAATRSYQVAIASARERVMLQSPYFVPDATTLDALINAAASGVRVDFMITGHLDKKVPYWAAESYFESLLEAGARIWLWQKGFFHAKSLTIDRSMTAVGTLNLDIRSLHINKELMVWVYDESVVDRMAGFFESDLAECSELTLDDVRGWSPVRRFRNSGARLMSHLL